MLTEGGSEILAAVLGGVVVIFALMLWAECRKPRRIVPEDQPYGDAVDTPKMIQQTRRANYERRKA